MSGIQGFSTAGWWNAFQQFGADPVAAQSQRDLYEDLFGISDQLMAGSGNDPFGQFGAFGAFGPFGAFGAFGPFGALGGLQLDPMMLVQLFGMFMTRMAQQMSQMGQGGACGCSAHGGLPGGRFSNRRSTSPQSWGAPSGHNAGSPQNVPVPQGAPSGPRTSGAFLQAALAQNGDRYVYGAETNLNDANPHTFDCSELVQWAGHQAGVRIPDGSANQRNWVRQHGTEISVDQALRTPGALLFRNGHVAISLGDGRTIEAKGSRYGVGVFNGQGRFTSAGLVPGMSYG